MLVSCKRETTVKAACCGQNSLCVVLDVRPCLSIDNTALSAPVLGSLGRGSTPTRSQRECRDRGRDERAPGALAIGVRSDAARASALVDVRAAVPRRPSARTHPAT